MTGGVPRRQTHVDTSTSTRVGTVVWMQMGVAGVVTAEHATDPCRPQVSRLVDRTGSALPHPRLVDTVARTDGGQCSFTVLEAVDADDVGLDPFTVVAL